MKRNKPALQPATASLPLIGLALFWLARHPATDLQVSQSLYQPQFSLWIFFEAFGEWPFFMLATLASSIWLAALQQQAPPSGPGRRSFLRRFLRLTGLGSAVLIGSQPVYYLTRTLGVFHPAWVALGGLAVGFGLTVLGRQSCRKRHLAMAEPRQIAFAQAGVWFFYANLILVNGLKLVWGRVRFRDLTLGEAFTAWHWPQGFTGQFSFPSAHVAHSAAILFLTLLPQIWSGGQSWRRWRRLTLSLLAGLWIIGVAVSRIGIGAHYPSDVLASLAIGISLFSALRWRFVRKQPEDSP
jgi:membrane-associated phospholipid phosphatase